MKTNKIVDEANLEQFEQLLFVLMERNDPTVIVITCDSIAKHDEIYNKICKELAEYKIYDLNISERKVESLYSEYVNNLPESILQSKPAEYIVNVFGIENSLFAFNNGTVNDSTLIAELNFERELFFRSVPFVSIIWLDPYTKNRLQNEAKDLWDWLINNAFEFKDQLSNHNLRQKKTDESVFIGYARKDYNEAKKLYNELEQLGLSPWIETEEINLGEDWRLGIKNALLKSPFCLILFSSKSTENRRYLQKELRTLFEIMESLHDSIPYIIPVRLDDCLLFDERLDKIQHIDLFPSFETGVRKLLHIIKHCKNIEQHIIKGTKKQAQISKEEQAAIEKRINKHQTDYDRIKFNTSTKQRLIKDKILLQKLMAQGYLELKRNNEAINCLRIALALAQNIPGNKYEEDEISFLLNQLYFKPELMKM